jgi:proteasome accessory factor B
MTVDATERIVNLAIYLAATPRPVSATEIAANVSGYPPGQTPEAFGRMFERDKEDLRAAGLVLRVDRSGDVERYRLDEDATYAETIGLTPLEAVELRTAAAAMLADDSFPFASDLRPAISKVVAATHSPAGHADAIVPSASADESPEAQGAAVALLTGAVTDRKRVAFAYTGAQGRTSQRDVEPWGLFARDGRWYLVAFDTAADAVRVFAVPRMTDTTVAPRPKTPDFEPPAGFDVSRYMVMPFQFGAHATEAVVRLTGPAARRADALTAGQGTLSRLEDCDGLVWRVPVAGPDLFARWIVAAGPGVAVLGPPELTARLRAGLEEVARLHG